MEKNSDGSVISAYEYTVYAIGQRERVDRIGSAFSDSNATHASVPSNPIDWSYDILGQVAKADYSDSTLDQTYTYDQIGNRVSKTQSAATTQYTSNALNQFTSKTTSGSTENYLYDADGNLLSDGEATYTWDGEIYAEDVTGATRGQNVCNDVAHATGFFHERTIEYASWPVSGSGTCPKSK